jgi:hypothetical protein
VNIFVEKSSAGSFQSIKKDGICYKRVGDSPLAPDVLFIDEGFDSCLECENAPSQAPSPQPSQQVTSPSPSQAGSPSPPVSKRYTLCNPPSPSPSLNPSPSPAIVNACEGETCSGTNNPSIVLKIGDPSASYAGGSITWCGKTWTQAQINANNFEQCVCPTTYVGPRKNYNTSFTKTAEHIWRHYAFGKNELLMQRFSASGSFSAENRLYPRLTLANNGINVYDIDVLRYYFSTLDYQIFNLNFISADNLPNQTDYQISDLYFGTYTDGGSGLEFSWNKGVNW